jgi:glutathione synthase
VNDEAVIFRLFILNNLQQLRKSYFPAAVAPFKQFRTTSVPDMLTASDRIHWALTHGIAMGLKLPLEDDKSKIRMIHAPFTLESYQFPKAQFEKAVGLAQHFNILVEKITRNPRWLIETLKPTAVSDMFIRQLINIYEIVLKEGINQPISLAINRSDYMLHSKEGDTRNLLQVELNTIASSFGSLSTKISEMHRELHEMEEMKAATVATGNVKNIPLNNALDEISSGIAAAHNAYLKQTGLCNADVFVAIIVQPGERNFADQRLLQYQIWKNHKVRCFRVTLGEVAANGILGDNNQLSVGGKNTSVVYFRAGYSPDDHPTEKEWDARLLIERSFAIKCPTIAVHLAGCKKVQQVLADPGVLEMFISSQDQRDALRSVFAGLYNLAEPLATSENAESESRLLKELKVKVEIEDGLNYVMKPQREGGGNNFYGPAVAEALRTMSLDEQASYILMERILPPSADAELLRDGESHKVLFSQPQIRLIPKIFLPSVHENLTHHTRLLISS